jgi:hypothetical protein
LKAFWKALIEVVLKLLGLGFKEIKPRPEEPAEPGELEDRLKDKIKKEGWDA